MKCEFIISLQLCDRLGTLDGSLDALLPLSEKSFRRLQYLQRKLNTFVPHHAGLNPRAFRYPKRHHFIDFVKKVFMPIFFFF